jgi:hypothetical protein
MVRRLAARVVDNGFISYVFGNYASIRSFWFIREFFLKHGKTAYLFVTWMEPASRCGRSCGGWKVNPVPMSVLA